MRLSALLLAAATLAAQPRFQTRADYGARLEPLGVIQHGAGQDPGAFSRYSQAMPDSAQPLVYMTYLSLKDLGADWAGDLRRRMALSPEQFVTLQIGLSMTTDGRPQDSYEQRVADGDFDPQIRHLVAGLTSLATPVYLRIGYEFNGLAWNGYRPEPYKAAFRRIAAAIREARPELEVATVWCAAIDGTRNFEEFYPGDDVVDWYGIDIFSARHFADPDVAAFAAAAEARRKPLMLGETTPRGEGAQAPRAWDAWFEPFFGWMAATPQVKQFNYINWDWAERGRALGQPNWVTWGDARLETALAEPVRRRYIDTLAAPVFQHAADESAFRRALGATEERSPTPPPALERADATGGLGFSWAALEDAPGFQLGRYYVYRDDRLIGFSLTPRFVDETARAGVAASYRVAIMSRAGTLTEPSEPLETAPEAIVRASDAFDEAGTWRVESFHANARGNATFAEGAARLELTQASGTNWHLQFRRFVPLNAGHRYRLFLRARADRTIGVPLWLQQDGGSNTIYLNRTLSLTSEWQTFELVLAAPATTRAGLAFILGNLPAGASVWVDSVEMVELPVA